MKTKNALDKAETQIFNLRKEINYDTRDFTVGFIVEQFQKGEYYIPDEYQRKYIWLEEDKNRLIESILLGYPIPFMFFSDTEDGRCEIIDGAQRTQALEEFINKDLILSGLKKLNTLNDFSYGDLPESIRRKFNKSMMRVIVLSEETNIDIRQEIFNRINTSGRPASPIEIRRGTYTGPFMDFIKLCTENPLFQQICPIGEMAKKRYEHMELVLRFFAFLNNYQGFEHRVDDFLDKYVEDNLIFDETKFQLEFDGMINFVNKYFPNGFKKTPKAKSTPRVRFEAISVGVGLALRQQPNLVPKSLDWLEGDDFRFHTTTHASNSSARVAGRVEYVRDMLLKG